MLLAALSLAATVALQPGDAPQVGSTRGVRAVAFATVEVLAAARASAEAAPEDLRRQVRRNALGQTVVEFE